MNRTFTNGQIVHCPADRGESAYYGEVVHVGTEQNTNIYNTPYIWVTVKGPDGHKHVWPSHRLG